MDPFDSYVYLPVSTSRQSEDCDSDVTRAASAPVFQDSHLPNSLGWDAHYRDTTSSSYSITANQAYHDPVGVQSHSFDISTSNLSFDPNDFHIAFTSQDQGLWIPSESGVFTEGPVSI